MGFLTELVKLAVILILVSCECYALHPHTLLDTVNVVACTLPFVMVCLHVREFVASPALLVKI